MDTSLGRTICPGPLSQPLLAVMLIDFPITGQGANNVLEAEIVTPAGDIVVANEYQNTDLFWAIRGELISLSVQAYPVPRTSLWSLAVSANNGTTDADWYKIVARALPAGGGPGASSSRLLPASSLTKDLDGLEADDGQSQKSTGRPVTDIS